DEVGQLGRDEVVPGRLVPVSAAVSLEVGRSLDGHLIARGGHECRGVATGRQEVVEPDLVGHDSTCCRCTIRTLAPRLSRKPWKRRSARRTSTLVSTSLSKAR